MYRVWPLLLTRTVPTPATLLALTVTAGEEDAGGDVPAGWLFPELAAVLEDADPHAAAAATAPMARLPYSSCTAGARPGRCMEIFTENPLLRQQAGWVAFSLLRGSCLAGLEVTVVAAPRLNVTAGRISDGTPWVPAGRGRQLRGAVAADSEI